MATPSRRFILPRFRLKTSEGEFLIASQMRPDNDDMAVDMYECIVAALRCSRVPSSKHNTMVFTFLLIGERHDFAVTANHLIIVILQEHQYVM